MIIRKLLSIGLLTVYFGGDVLLAETNAPLSRIAIPIEIDLVGVSAWVNARLPDTLVKQTQKHTCIKAERACTKIPEFRGLKIYSRMECIDVTPRISCTVEQQVKRFGPLSITGQGGMLVAKQAFDGYAKVSGRGDIGKHIRETTSGRLDLTVSAKPEISTDWQLTAKVSHNLRWQKRPTARLFNIFPVTFGKKAEAEINQEIDKFKLNELQPFLHGLDIKKRAETIWNLLQQPVPLSLPGNAVALLTFVPEGVALAPLQIDGGTLATKLAAYGSFRISDTDVQAELVPLPQLLNTPVDPGVSLTIPVAISLSVLQKSISSKLPTDINFGDTNSTTVTLRDVQLSKGKQDKLVTIFKTNYPVPLIGSVEVDIEIAGRPVWSELNQTLSLTDTTYKLINHEIFAWLLDDFLNSESVRSRLNEMITIGLRDDIDEFAQALNEIVFRDHGSEIKLKGEIVPRITDVLVREQLHLNFHLNGDLSVSAFAER